MVRHSALYLLYRVLTVEGLSAAIYLPWLLVNHHLRADVVALDMALYEIVLLVTQVPSGWLADRFGRRPSMAVGSLAQTAGMLAFLAADGPGLALAAFVLNAVGDAFRSGAQEAWLFESCPEGAFDRVYAAAQIWMLVAMTVLTLAGGLIADRFGYPVAWWLEISSAAAGLGLVGLMKEPARQLETAHEPSRVDWWRLVRVCPWGVVLAGASCMVASNAAAFAVKVSLAPAGPAISAVLASALPLVEAIGASMVLRLPFGVHGLALLAAGGLALVAWNPWAVLIPYMASGAVPALKLAAINREARDADRASLDSLAGSAELVLGAGVRPLVGRAVTAAHPVACIGAIALVLGAVSLSGPLARVRTALLAAYRPNGAPATPE